MIFAGFSLAKLFSGLAFWKGDKLGKLIFQIAIIALCLWLFHAKFIAKDAPVTTITEAGQIQNITQTRMHLIEVELGIFKIGLL